MSINTLGLGLSERETPPDNPSKDEVPSSAASEITITDIAEFRKRVNDDLIWNIAYDPSNPIPVVEHAERMIECGKLPKVFYLAMLGRITSLLLTTQNAPWANQANTRASLNAFMQGTANYIADGIAAQQELKNLGNEVFADSLRKRLGDVASYFSLLGEERNETDDVLMLQAWVLGSKLEHIRPKRRQTPESVFSNRSNTSHAA